LVLDLAKILVIMSVLEKLGLGIPETLEGYLLAALLQIRILVDPTIVILLLGKAILNLIIWVIAIKAKVISSLVSSDFLFRSINIRSRFLDLVNL
jgi:hypothetical protein